MVIEATGGHCDHFTDGGSMDTLESKMVFVYDDRRAEVPGQVFGYKLPGPDTVTTSTVRLNGLSLK